MMSIRLFHAKTAESRRPEARRALPKGAARAPEQQREATREGVGGVALKQEREIDLIKIKWMRFYMYVATQSPR